MKLENTPENKARFFALYWGQNVLVWHYNTGEKRPFKGKVNYCDQCENEYLELTPLSQITDEHATKVAQIVLNKPIEPLKLINWDWCYRVIVNREPSHQDENTIIEMYITIHYERSEIKFTWDYLKDGNIGTSERHCPNSFKAYQYLISKGYYVGDGTEITHGWVVLKDKELKP